MHSVNHYLPEFGFSSSVYSELWVYGLFHIFNFHRCVSIISLYLVIIRCKCWIGLVQKFRRWNSNPIFIQPGDEFLGHWASWGTFHQRASTSKSIVYIKYLNCQGANAKRPYLVVNFNFPSFPLTLSLHEIST